MQAVLLLDVDVVDFGVVHVGRRRAMRVGRRRRRVRVVVLAVVVGLALLVQPLSLPELGATVLEPNLKIENGFNVVPSLFLSHTMPAITCSSMKTCHGGGKKRGIMVKS